MAIANALTYTQKKKKNHVMSFIKGNRENMKINECVCTYHLGIKQKKERCRDRKKRKNTF